MDRFGRTERADGEGESIEECEECGAGWIAEADEVCVVDCFQRRGRVEDEECGEAGGE